MNNEIKISKSLEERAVTLIINGLNPIEALKQAINEENALCEEMIANKTLRAQKANKVMMQNVYALNQLTK